MMMKLYLTLIFFPLAIFAMLSTSDELGDFSLKWESRDTTPPPRELFQDAISTIKQAQVIRPHHDTRF
jgi:hypothetical protein